ncbi:MAG: AbrB/MazE/SpoVT family DNA-binding domain-containing protein [Candidatus Aenigmarchaeota archaeon]|nr:AbrB/MazE/SpoVT family DNA-binding domain-containing protein [Candidatus Aenigmarchaeota archaeon]
MPAKERIRTVNISERGQLVVPEDIRKDLGIKGEETLVLIEKGDEIVLKRESDVLKMMGSEDAFWKTLSEKIMERAWEKEDEIWDSISKAS